MENINYGQVHDFEQPEIADILVLIEYVQNPLLTAIDDISSVAKFNLSLYLQPLVVYKSSPGESVQLQ